MPARHELSGRKGRRQGSWLPVLGCLTLVLCFGCADRADRVAETGASDETRAAGATAYVSVIELEDGLVCRHAGHGATLAFEGARVSYQCKTTARTEVVLLGGLQSGEVERAILEREEGEWIVAESEMVQGTATGIRLADGIECAHAGFGATIEVEGNRVSYSCQAGSGDETVLLGELEPEPGGYSILLARLAPSGEDWTALDTELLRVTSP